jgi:hypothetical protein
MVGFFHPYAAGLSDETRRNLFDRAGFEWALRFFAGVVAQATVAEPRLYDALPDDRFCGTVQG